LLRADNDLNLVAVCFLWTTRLVWF